MPDERVPAAARQRLLRALARPQQEGPGGPVADPPDGRDPPERTERTGRPEETEGTERPEGTAGAVAARLRGAHAFDPGRGGVRALAVVAVVVVVAAAAVAWWSRPRPEPVAPPVAVTAATATPAASEPAELVVAVSGMVHEPGLIRLPPQARVADAIEAAGGALPDADLDHLNLARKVTDGELITVGIPPPPEDPAGGGASGQPGTGAKVNLNTATAAELETLPGVGPAIAQRIIDHRTEHGPFDTVGELREVSGIGDVRFAELEDLVTV